MARPKMILMDEPSMGLSPLLVKEVFAIIQKINRDLGVTILLVEQNARAALSVASHGYIMEQGKVVLDGTAAELRDNEDVKEFYLGGAGDQRLHRLDILSFHGRRILPTWPDDLQPPPKHRFHRQPAVHRLVGHGLHCCSISGPYDPVETPADAVKTDWEVELAFVIGTRAKNVSEADALKHVAGYCILNDVSERAWQIERQGQWTKGK
eukprot:gene59536-81480_t